MSNLLNMDDLKIESWPKRESLGGQHVGFTRTGVKVTHIPSGVEAFVEVSRSQFVNRDIACNMILAAITHPRF